MRSRVLLGAVLLYWAGLAQAIEITPAIAVGSSLSLVDSRLSDDLHDSNTLGGAGISLDLGIGSHVYLTGGYNDYNFFARRFDDVDFSSAFYGLGTGLPLGEKAFISYAYERHEFSIEDTDNSRVNILNNTQRNQADFDTDAHVLRLRIGNKGTLFQTGFRFFASRPLSTSLFMQLGYRF